MLTKKERLEAKMTRLAHCFDSKTGVKIGVPCRGKWRGTTDYSIRFDDGTSLFISNGMKKFEEKLDEMLTTYEGFEVMKQQILQVLQDIESTDNEIASQKGLNEYHILDIGYSKGRNFMGWFYLTIDVNGKITTQLETGLNYAICKAITTNDITPINNNFHENYFVAGGIEKPEYVFHNVGHNTKMYVLE